MSEALLATALFVLVIAVIVSRLLDEVAVSLLGVVLLVAALRSYDVQRAFEFIDWNILAILFGMWVTTGYMIKAGLAEYVVRHLLRRTNNYRMLLLLLAVASGFLSILVDNVIVILVFGSIAARLAKEARGNPVLAVVLVGLSANFMGTALLMGDLPPQLLHSIAGMEFLDFIVWKGVPSSFIILTITFAGVLAVYYRLVISREPGTPVSPEVAGDYNRGLLLVSGAAFAAIIVGMAIRPMLGVPLGFITIAGASALSVGVEAWRRAARARLPSFEEILRDVEWRALLFYASLFSLVGGLEASGALEEAARWMARYLSLGAFQGYTVSYWVVAALSTFIEHDALLITFLYLVHDVASALPYDPGILYWGMAWSATLASNLTTAAAPALYVAVAIAEKESGHRVSGAEFLGYSAPWVLASLVINYIVTVVLWLPLVTGL